MKADEARHYREDLPEGPACGSSAEETCETELTLKNRRGLHARASARFVRLAESFDADIRVEKDGTEVCGTSIMGLMLLAAARGDGIRVRACGREAKAAIEALSRLVEDRFEEEE